MVFECEPGSHALKEYPESSEGFEQGLSGRTYELLPNTNPQPLCTSQEEREQEAVDRQRHGVRTMPTLEVL